MGRLNYQQLAEKAGQELRAILRVSPLALALALAVVVMWRVNPVATGGLFQSQVATPTPPPTATVPVPPTQTAQPASATPGLTATTVATATQSITPPTSPATMTATLTPSAVPTAPELLTPQATETEAPRVLPTNAVPAAAPVAPPPTVDESQRYPEEEANLRYDWGLLFDTLALGISYVWLGCGILLILALPILFAVLWVRSRGRREQAEPPATEE